MPSMLSASIPREMGTLKDISIFRRNELSCGRGDRQRSLATDVRRRYMVKKIKIG